MAIIPNRKSGTRGVFQSYLDVDGVQLRHIQICHKAKRAEKLLRSFSKKLKKNFISKDTHTSKENINDYINILNFNAFLHIIKRTRIEKITIYDPHATLANQLQKIMQHLKFLRVVTNNTDIYFYYNEECLENIGCCAAITNELPRVKQQIIFCAYPLPKDYDTKGAFIIGRGGFNSVITSNLNEESAQKCPKGIDIKDFFTVLAVEENCISLLSAVPEFLENGKITVNINALPV